MRVFILLLFLNLNWMCSCQVFEDKLVTKPPVTKTNGMPENVFNDRCIIACHTTDFLCFKKQYKALRDNALMGNDRLLISHYEPYVFTYGNTESCIKLTGWEESELTGIQMDSITKEFSWTLELPFKIQQVRSSAIKCVKPENEFSVVGNQHGILKKFTGNATIQVVYPYELQNKKGRVHMILKKENLDVILDIPDLSHYNKASAFEKNLYDLSEWAYGVVQHIDVAQHFALPYTTQLRTFTEIIPLHKLLLLYPDEEYDDMQLKYIDSPSKCSENIS